ncbi:acyltransferase family protein [Janibacter sp. G1551]|uniref:acyltransferase family protein n=1 Tax=Janibacter sp. G1551 TaxID=3420440 RepID=UPI003D07EDD8
MTTSVPGTAATGRGPRVVGIDGLRAIAALAVFVCHLGGYWSLTDLPARLPELMAVGAQGVDVFIVLSGFVLGLPAFRTDRPLNMGNFLRRRATRLLPPYFVALGLAAAIALSPMATWIVAERASASDLAWHAALLQTWNPPTLGTINGSLWSVALEAQLYLTFPLVILFARRFGIWPVVGAAAVLSTSLTMVSLPGALGDALTDEHNLPIRIVQFCVGVACAHLVSRGHVPRATALWAALVVGGLLAVGWSTADVALGRAVIWSLPSAAAILLVAASVGPSLAATPFERWGLASYSFYLVHQPVLLVVGHVLRPSLENDWVALVAGMTVGLAVTCLVAFALYLVVERPSHHYGRAHFPVFDAERPADAATSPRPMPPSRPVG